MPSAQEVYLVRTISNRQGLLPHLLLLATQILAPTLSEALVSLCPFDPLVQQSLIVVAANNNAAKPSLFGAAQPAAAPAGGLFGQPAANQATGQPKNNIFGGGGGIFGQNNQQQNATQPQTSRKLHQYFVSLVC